MDDSQYGEGKESPNPILAKNLNRMSKSIHSISILGWRGAIPKLCPYQWLNLDETETATRPSRPVLGD
ncbi:MAG TPA: hypothetical protein VFY10_00910, partial [Dehalococcoidia bacterium]|nr:hypothetical protein [Dehalococcoidia bacterium]